MSDHSRVPIKDKADPPLKAEATLAEHQRPLDGTGNSSRSMDDRVGCLGDVSKANGHVSSTSVGRHPMEMKYDGDRDDRGSGQMMGRMVKEGSTNPNVNVSVAASAKHKLEMKTETSSSNSNSNSDSASEKENTDNEQAQNKAQYTYEDEEAMTAARGGHPFWDSMSADPMT